MTRFWRGFDRCSEALVVMLMAAMVVIMAAQVVARYIFSNPFVWAEEIAAYLFIWIVFLGAGLAFKRRSHIVVDYFARMLPAAVFRGISLVVNLMVVAFLLLLGFQGIGFVQANWGVPAYTTKWVGLPSAYAAVSAGAALMILGLVRSLSDDS